jgi:hypothetical protein
VKVAAQFKVYGLHVPILIARIMFLNSPASSQPL